MEIRIGRVSSLTPWCKLLKSDRFGMEIQLMLLAMMRGCNPPHHG